MKTMSWAVNKQGFGSIYALGLLWIVVAFVSLMITQAITFAKTQQTKHSLHFAQLYAIYHVKAILVDMQNSQVQEISQEEEGDEEVSEPEGFYIQSETCTYDNQMIFIQYEQHQAIVMIEGVTFTLTCDFETGEILELAYS